MSAPEPVVHLTRTAERDLENIALYTRRVWGTEQPDAATIVVRRILHSRQDASAAVNEPD